MLNAPLTLSSLGVETLSIGLATSTNRQTGRDLLGHVTADIECTADGLEQRQTVHRHEGGVVGQAQIVVDLSDERQGQVAELLVSDDGKGLADLSQVGGGEGLERVLVETQGAVELLKRRQRDGPAGAEGQVGGPDQVGQLDDNSLVVVGEIERGGNIAKLHLDLGDVAVVGDLERLGLLDVDAGERLEPGVLDVDGIGLLDLCGKAYVAQVGQGVPSDGLHLLELGEVDAVEALEGVQRQVAGDGLHVAGTDLLNVGVVLGDQIAVQHLDAAEGDVFCRARGDGNGAGEGRARGQGSRVALVLDGGRPRSGALSCVALLSGCLWAIGRHVRGQNVP
jgi:hypothetical protein